ncbi:MAG: cellular communication/signal transduction, partial [uncultured Gemmatimonadaceae bacterium]
EGSVRLQSESAAQPHGRSDLRRAQRPRGAVGGHGGRGAGARDRRAPRVGRPGVRDGEAAPGPVAAEVRGGARRQAGRLSVHPRRLRVHGGGARRPAPRRRGPARRFRRARRL